MPVARIVAGIGRALIAAGLLLVLFVAYQLWGTGLAEARAQDELREELAAVLATTTSSTSTTSTTAAAPGAPATTAPPPTTTPTTAPPRPEGAAIALIRIPSVGIDKAVVEGVSAGDLEKGPGHYPRTPMPGHSGNAAIAGHRTTYGAPFGDLGDVEEGDDILITTRDGDFRYVVDRVSVVSPSRVEVLAPTEEARITLTTCHPRFSARQRLIVSGVLATDPLLAPPEPPAEAAPPVDDEGAGGVAEGPADEGGPGDGRAAADPSEGDDPTVEAPAGGDADGEVAAASLDDPSLAGDPSARLPAAAWAAATALVALAAWVVGRRWHRWPAYLLALPLGAVTLFRCFEQVARLFPANI